MAARRREQGFTLLEVLVVVVILGIIAASVSLTIGSAGPAARVQDEADRFAQILELTSEEAIMRARAFGVLLDDTQYQFFQLDEGNWVPFEGDVIWTPHRLPDGMEMRLEMEEQELELGGARDEDADEDEKEQVKPQIYLLNSGEPATPFAVLFQVVDQNTSVRFRVSMAFDGYVTTEGPLLD